MTQEEKDLVVKDLSSRIPYGVRVYIEYDDGKIFEKRKLAPIMIHDYIKLSLDKVIFKPYLRPMEDMTEKEKRHIQNRFCYQWDGESVMELINYCKIDISDITDFINWLYEHHLDFNFLIEKGLALKAPKDMYEIK